jgi:protease-4
MFQRRKEDKFLAKVGRFFRRFFVAIGVAATISVILLSMTISRMINYVPPSLPDKMVLTYTFKSGLEEIISKPAFSQPLLRPASTLHEVIEALADASKDDRVKGFVAKIEDMSFSPAQIQEIRDAVKKFRASGKFAYIYTDEFGGFSSGMGDYYLASAFEQIWLQPVGSVSINGVAAEVPFFKEIFEKVGVSADFSHRGIYKSASESLTESTMSVPHREMMTGLIHDLGDQMETGIAADRHLTLAEIKQIVDGAPYSDTEALTLKLVDKLGYYDQVNDAARIKAGITEAEAEKDTVDLLGYEFRASTTSLNKGMAGFASKFLHKEDSQSVHQNKPKIALIIASGEIIPYANVSPRGMSSGGIMADKIIEAFQDAQKDKDVVAVVLRIDSPGGSPSASESIRRAIVQTQQKGKPVIVSMSGYAASGGYWVATSADKIVAQPATVTGSIGVFGGKIVFEKLWGKLGVHWDAVNEGQNARMWSSNAPFSVSEKLRFEAMLDNIYESFITRVMTGRKMTREQVLAIAEGHVWTGRQAKERGLVDALGGLDTAVQLARTAAKLTAEQDAPLVRFPAQKSTLEMFIDIATKGVSFNPTIDIRAEDVLKSLASEIHSETQQVPQLHF